MMLKEDVDRYLGELYTYVENEQDEIPVVLTAQEADRYVEIVDILHKNNIEIPFGIEI